MARKILKHKGYKYLLFRFDPNKEKPFPYFKDVSGLCKICDYILFVETGKSFYILLVELKQGKGTATKQLEASEIFAQFVINSGIRVGVPFTNDICYKKVKISESTGKPKTTVRNLVIDNGIIHYKHKTEFNIWDIIDAE